jgi:hypothetical protein
MHHLFGDGSGNSSWLCTSGSNGVSGNSDKQAPSTAVNRSRTSQSRWRRKTRESAAKSKKGLWGPTHSFSSNEDDKEDEDDSDEPLRKDALPREKIPIGNDSEATNSTKSSTDSSPENNPNSSNNKTTDFDGGFNRHEPMETMQHTLGRVWNNLQCMEDTTLGEVFNTRWNGSKVPREGEEDETQLDKQPATIEQAPPVVTLNESGVMDYLDEFCSPCRPKNLTESATFQQDSTLGIQRLEPPNVCFPSFGMNKVYPTNTAPLETRASALAAPNSRTASGAGNGSSRKDASSVVSTETAADRRRQRHARRQLNAQCGAATADDSSSAQEAYEITNGKKVMAVWNEPKVNHDALNNANKVTVPVAWTNLLESSALRLPMDQLELNKQKAVELERSISELTMRSSYGEATAKIAENRRMAYYAVGRHHRQSGRGGNRRCYFTGKLILGGAPFYAGSVQQGLRTLVVFCLPSALGLPKEMQRGNSPSMRSVFNGRPSLGSTRDNGSVTQSLGYNGANKSTSSLLSRKSSRLSRLSSIDDTSMSVEEELDPNWELDRDYLLRVLPEPTQGLLEEMAMRYPAQFETLPIQVRSPPCWKLYVKFCFFSGLPIAEGEMHYKVRDDIADQYGEEVILSHEVMEAVNGDSAEILRLPNLKAFRYLRKHYQQQSAKLPDSCFQRQAWEMVRPEV